MRPDRTNVQGRRRSGAASPGGSHRSAFQHVVWCEVLELRRLLSATHHIVAVPPGTELANGVVTITGSNQADTIRLSQNTSAGTLTATVNGAVSTFAVADVTQIQVNPLKGNDYVYGGNVTIPLIIAGGKGNQSLVAGNGTDTITVGPGNNVLAAGIGTDTFITNTGHNRLILGAGNDTIVGKAKNLVIRGTGTVTVVGKGKGNVLADKASPLVITSDVVRPDTVFGTATGYTPTQVRAAYDFGSLSDPTFTNRGDGQAVAVVIPYNTPDITQSLATYSTTFDLPAPDINHFQIVYTNGTVPPTDPNPNDGWELEAATNVESIHMIAPDAKIYLVLAESSAFPDLFAAVSKAESTLDSNFGGGVVDISWGSQGGELDPVSENTFDTTFQGAQAKNVSFVAASGDVGGVISYPAISPYVTAVGGTTIALDSNGNPTAAQSAWVSSGSGRSATYPIPSYQQGNVAYAGPGVVTGTGNGTASTLGTFRTNVDVSYDGNPATGIATYDAQTFGDINADGVADSGWLPGGAGGTSVASAQWAGLVALANQTRAANGRGFLGQQLNANLYHVAETYGQEDFTDITSGASGGNAATTGFDLATGWGTPRATNLITRLGISDVTTVTGGITWTADYQLPITLFVGGLQGPGAGFFVGNGTVAGGPSGFHLTFTPANKQPINYTLVAGQNNETDTAPYATITSFVVNTLKRSDLNGHVYGTGTATLLVQVTTPVYIPPTAPSTSAPTPGGGANTGGNGSGSGYGPSTTPTPTPVTTGSGYYGIPTPTPTTPTPTPTPTTTGTAPSSPNGNPFTTATTTDFVTLSLSFTGTTYTSASGRTHLRGAFVAIDPNTGQPAQVGIATTFTGKFKSAIIGWKWDTPSTSSAGCRGRHPRSCAISCTRTPASTPPPPVVAWKSCSPWRNVWNDFLEHRANPDREDDRRRLHRTLSGILQGYYGDVERPVVFDKSRGWPAYIEMLEATLGRKVKVLVPVRNLSERPGVIRKAPPQGRGPQRRRAPAGGDRTELFSDADGRRPLRVVDAGRPARRACIRPYLRRAGAGPARPDALRRGRGTDAPAG